MWPLLAFKANKTLKLCAPDVDQCYATIYDTIYDIHNHIWVVVFFNVNLACLRLEIHEI